MRNKRGLGLLTGTVIFVILNLTIIIIMFLAISRVGTASSLYEEAYAKQIGLLIDASKPGTTLNIDLSELYQIAQSNNVGISVVIACDRNEVYVKASPGKGYRFNYFTEMPNCEYSIDNQKRRLTIKI